MAAGREVLHLLLGLLLRRVAHPIPAGEGAWGADRTGDGVSRVEIFGGPGSSFLFCRGDHSS